MTYSEDDPFWRAAVETLKRWPAQANINPEGGLMWLRNENGTPRAVSLTMRIVKTARGPQRYWLVADGELVEGQPPTGRDDWRYYIALSENLYCRVDAMAAYFEDWPIAATTLWSNSGHYKQGIDGLEYAGDEDIARVWAGMKLIRNTIGVGGRPPGRRYNSAEELTEALDAALYNLRTAGKLHPTLKELAAALPAPLHPEYLGQEMRRLLGESWGEWKKKRAL